MLVACGSQEPEVVPPEPPPAVVHLSLDDAPWMVQKATAVPLPAAEVADRNRRLVAMLAERDVTASVFFNCDRLQEGDGSIETWAAAGHVVGNHSASHPSLNRTAPEDWLADVRRCHDVLTARLPEAPRWFRYPHLQQGRTPEDKEAAADGLAAMGYRNAPVTVATTEWMLAFAYRRALNEGDDAKQAATPSPPRRRWRSPSRATTCRRSRSCTSTSSPWTTSAASSTPGRPAACGS